MNKDKLKKLIYDMESENKEVRYKMFEFIKSFSQEENILVEKTKF